MPEYVYKCPKCEKVIILMKSVDDRDDLPECVGCDLRAVRQLVAPAMVGPKGKGQWGKI